MDKILASWRALIFSSSIFQIEIYDTAHVRYLDIYFKYLFLVTNLKRFYICAW